MSDSSDATKNKLLLQTMYACMLAGDLTGFLSGVDDNVITHQSPALPYGGVYRGKQALASLLAETIFPLIDGTKIKMIAPLIADDHRVIATFTVPAKKTGKELMLLEQATISNGKVVELRVFYFDPTVMSS